MILSLLYDKNIYMFSEPWKIFILTKINFGFHLHQKEIPLLWSHNVVMKYIPLRTVLSVSVLLNGFICTMFVNK